MLINVYTIYTGPLSVQAQYSRFLVASATNSTKTHTTKVNDTLRGNTETAAKKIRWKYPMTQINNNNNNNNNNNVPKATKDKVCSAVQWSP
jgi:Tfp pilus assembly major pilin PilA